jgi:hypothetical protein
MLDEQQALADLLARTPLRQRLTALMCAVLGSSADPLEVAKTMATLSADMSVYLNADQRMALAYHLQTEAEYLDGPLH